MTKQNSKRLEKTMEPLLGSRIYSSTVDFVRIHDVASSSGSSVSISAQSNQENRVPAHCDSNSIFVVSQTKKRVKSGGHKPPVGPSQSRLERKYLSTIN